ncbi:DUF1237-domain-containing protein [Metschnikowia bicuspidata]|uniref:DUF1237-domain-containing protein n=1 Tax=Metschnikowia bicuspidata TaxID=27322 RepID=A0A4P9ZDN6_9ASCO|nr:DUF1237-domain-containing protein [Metschnikowia bicuspidata]
MFKRSLLLKTIIAIGLSGGLLSILGYYIFSEIEDSPSRDEICTDYVKFSKIKHDPLSSGKRKFPLMRPPLNCRTFQSTALEFLIEDLKSKIADPDLARLMENTLPNTLDTTILWHKPRSSSSSELPQTFVVTGDIHAEWLRDSARQLSVFQPLLKYDLKLQDLIKGAINTQTEYLRIAPYCNAFHPPPDSGVKQAPSAIDDVNPKPDWSRVFECKYEIDSLASFLTLTNDYIENSGHDLSVINKQWAKAFENVLRVVEEQSLPLFDPETGSALPSFYSFKRKTNIGTETLPLGGAGNPVNYKTGLVRSAFRPSDDANILQFFVPGNIHMLSELKRIAKNVLSVDRPLSVELKSEGKRVQKLIKNIERGLEEFAVIKHPQWGKVLAYEVDGYGGRIFMDDANIPSLLSIPEMGYMPILNEVYQNTRRMILSKEGNPYFIKGKEFEGVGGPHIGIKNAWPMSLLMRIRTSDDDTEILDSLELVMDSTAGLGLMHESVNVNKPNGDSYTRPWFAWCNSEFGKTIIHLAKSKPHLIFESKSLINLIMDSFFFSVSF